MRSFRQLLLGTLVLALRHRISVGQNDTTTDKPYTVKPMIPAEMKITSWNDMPFSGLVMENGTWVGKGYAFYLLELLRSKLNFTYTIVPPNKHVLDNNRSGILNLLREKKVDMAVAFLPILPEMRKYCTFSVALDRSELTALMKRPQKSATGSGLLAPFDQTVWLLVLTSVIVVGPIIYVFAMLRAKLWSNPDSENYSLLSCVWFVYSSLLKQGTTIVATTDSTRILFATWWIFILILTSFYTANLTAFLTRSQFTLPINSLQDIVRKSYQWVAYKGRTIEYLLSQSDELVLLKTGKSKGRYITTYEYPVQEIFNTVDNNKLFLGEHHYLQTLIFEDYINKSRMHLEYDKRCTYVIMPKAILVTNKAFAFPLGSSLMRPINKELRALVEAGIIERSKLKDLPFAEVCPVDLRSTERQLTNNDLSLTYKVVITGYAIAAMVFILEIIITWIKKKPRERRKASDRRYGCAQRCCNPRRRSKEPVTAEFMYTAKINNRPLDNRIVLQKRIPQPLDRNTAPNLAQGKKHCINGRDYYVVMDRGGDQRLIPIRTPSAFLFQYAA